MSQRLSLNRFLLLSTLALWGSLKITRAETSPYEPTPVERQVINLVYLSPKRPLPKIEEKDKEQVLALLREIAQQKKRDIKNSTVSMEGASTALIRMGDLEGIKYYCAFWIKIKGRDWDVLRNAKQPLVIPYLAPALYMDEEFGKKYPPDDVSWPPLPYAAARLIINNLNSDSMPHKIRYSVLTFDKELSAKERDLTKYMKKWWEANKAAFESGKLDQVQPLD